MLNLWRTNEKLIVSIISWFKFEPMGTNHAPAFSPPTFPIDILNIG